jgi:hypothetical protein
MANRRSWHFITDVCMRSLLISLIGTASIVSFFACGSGKDLPPPAAYGRSEAKDAMEPASARPSRDSGMDEASVVDGEVPVNPVLGKWVHDKGDCSYIYTFDENGRYTSDSTSGESVVGSYSIQSPASSGGRYYLHLTISSENNAVDCEGEMVDETGKSFQAFLEVVDRDHINVYNTATGGSVRFTFIRST